MLFFSYFMAMSLSFMLMNVIGEYFNIKKLFVKQFYLNSLYYSIKTKYTLLNSAIFVHYNEQ